MIVFCLSCYLDQYYACRFHHLFPRHITQLPPLASCSQPKIVGKLTRRPWTTRSSTIQAHLLRATLACLVVLTSYASQRSLTSCTLGRVCRRDWGSSLSIVLDPSTRSPEFRASRYEMLCTSYASEANMSSLPTWWMTFMKALVLAGKTLSRRLISLKNDKSRIDRHVQIPMAAYRYKH